MSTFNQKAVNELVECAYLRPAERPLMCRNQSNWHGNGRCNGVRRVGGFTLVELMVGMVLSLLGVVVIYTVLTNTQSYRRSAAGVSSAQQNGAIALYYLERDIRQAGYGIQATARNRTQPAATLATQLAALYGCNVSAQKGATAFNFTMAPFVITNGANANTPDSMAILYGNSPLQSGGTPLAANQSVTGAGDVWVQSIQGFAVNDKFIIASTAANNCEMSQISAICNVKISSPDATCSGSTFSFSQTAGDYAKSLAHSYGPGVAAGTPSTTAVYNLGQQPVLATYVVANTGTGQFTLTRTDQFEAGGPVARTIGDDIVNMKIQVGYNDGTFRSTAVGANWSNVTSLRIALVARSNLLEKDVVKQAVDQGTLHLLPASLLGATVVTPAVDMDLTASADLQRYRYKVYVTVVPLRNLLWNPS